MKTTTLLALLLLASSAPWAVAHSDSDADRRIEDSAKSSYASRSEFRDRITVKADDGVVTLTGTVQSQDQKRYAEETASQIPGVSRVENRLRVESEPAERSDDWIAFKTKSMLLLKPNVSATNTHISVHNGVVTLTGTADSQAQKELTATYVKDIEGVKSVDNDITVRDSSYQVSRRDADDTRINDTRTNAPDDSGITAKIKYQLLTHRSTSALKTKVETNDGVVTITGEAGSDAERDLATRLAKDVNGVRSVNNQMTVKSEMER